MRALVNTVTINYALVDRTQRTIKYAAAAHFSGRGCQNNLEIGAILIPYDPSWQAEGRVQNTKYKIQNTDISHLSKHFEKLPDLDPQCPTVSSQASCHFAERLLTPTNSNTLPIYFSY